MKQKGYIYRASGCWYVRYRETINGERQQVSKCVCPIEPHQVRLKKAPPDVREAADRLLAPLNQLEATGSSNMTLDQFVEHHYWPWLKAEREPGTAYNYKLVYNNHFKDQLGPKRLWEVRTATVSQALAETFRQHPGLTKRTLVQHRSIVYSIFKLAISQGYAPAPNPAGRDCLVPGSKNPGKPTEAYDLDTILRILGVVTGQAKAAVAIAGFAGLSRSEIMGLKWSDYSGVQISVRRKVWEGKVGKTKTLAREAPVPVIETLAEILDEYRAELDNPKLDAWMFPTRNQTPKSLKELYKYQLKKQLAVENIPWHGWHAFRRGIATNLKSLGVDDKIIQGILRHAKLATTTEIYMKNNTVAPELRAGLDKLQDAIKSRVQ